MGYFYDTIFKLKKKFLLCLLWILEIQFIFVLWIYVLWCHWIPSFTAFLFFLRLFRKILEGMSREEYLQVWWWSILAAFSFVKISNSSSLFMKDIFSIHRICDVRVFYFHLLKMWFIFLLLFFLTWSAFIYSYHSPVCILFCLLSRCFGSYFNFSCLSLSAYFAHVVFLLLWVHQAS